METIGTLIRKGREKRGFEREALAKRLGISKSYLAQLEADAKVHLSPTLAAKLIKTAGVKRSILGLMERHNRKVHRYRFPAKENN